MKINVGKPDKIMRIVLGVAIIGVGAYFGSWWAIVGLVPLLTGFMNFCPIYLFLASVPVNTMLIKTSISKNLN